MVTDLKKCLRRQTCVAPNLCPILLRQFLSLAVDFIFTIAPTVNAEWLHYHEVTSLLAANRLLPDFLQITGGISCCPKIWVAQVWCLWILAWRLMAANTMMTCCWNDCCQRSVAPLEISMCAGQRTCTYARDTVAFLARETPQFIGPNTPNLNLADYRVWGVMQ